jgi:hypothetical protein
MNVFCHFSQYALRMSLSVCLSVSYCHFVSLSVCLSPIHCPSVCCLSTCMFPAVGTMRRTLSLRPLGNFLQNDIAIHGHNSGGGGGGETSEGAVTQAWGPQTCVNHSGPLRSAAQEQWPRSVSQIPVSIIQGPWDMLHRGTDAGQVPKCLCQSLWAPETGCTGAMTQVSDTNTCVNHSRSGRHAAQGTDPG